MRELKEEEKNYVLSITEKHINRDLLIKFFANFEDEKAKFNTTDWFTLPAGKLFNKENTLTTVGLYIYNLYVLHDLHEHLGYINESITKKQIGKIEGQLSVLLMNDVITPKQFIGYIERTQWLGFFCSDFLTTSMSMAFIKPNKNVQKRKAELVKQNKQALDAGDIPVAAAIEEELVKMADKELQNDPSYDNIRSGAKIKLGSQYKSMNIMKGPMKDNATGRYSVSTNNYSEGMPVEDYAAFSDTIVYAAYSRAVGTQKGGYESKKMFAAFQSVSLDKEGSDCKSTKTLDIVLTSEIAGLYDYRFFVEGNKLVQLTPENRNNYIGRLMKFRSPKFCKSEKICSKCAGELYYKLGITNIGLTASKIGSTLLNMSLKNFHDTTIHMGKLDYKKYMS